MFGLFICFICNLLFVYLNLDDKIIMYLLSLYLPYYSTNYLLYICRYLKMYHTTLINSKLLLIVFYTRISEYDYNMHYF